MLKLKKWNGALAKKKFARYRLWFFLSASCFLLVAILEVVWFGSGVRVAFSGEGSLRALFVPLATAESVLFTLTCLLGITVYAPAVQLLVAVLRGFASGFVLSSLLPLSDGRSWGAALLSLSYLVFSSGWLFSYASFCTCVSLRLFSAKAERGVGGEGELFGGTLFYSKLTCDAVNLRFLFSYTLFYFTALGIQLALAACYSLAGSRLF